MLKNFKLKRDQERAQTKFNLFGKFITPKSSIIDIGAGSGQFSMALELKGHIITAIDVIDKTNTELVSPIIYNGHTLPFKNKSFDISMLIAVLHHCPEPERVLAEAVRVSKNRIFVLEDVYSNRLMKYLTWFMDSLMNLEFIGHPHSNKSEAEWESLFNENRLKVIHKHKVKLMLFFTQVVYVLEKNEHN